MATVGHAHNCLHTRPCQCRRRLALVHNSVQDLDIPSVIVRTLSMYTVCWRMGYDYIYPGVSLGFGNKLGNTVLIMRSLRCACVKPPEQLT